MTTPSSLPLEFLTLLILYTFDPNSEKLSDTEFLIPSIEVRIPTRDAIPIAIMAAVRKTLSLLDFIEATASKRFQLNLLKKEIIFFKLAIYANVKKKNLKSRFSSRNNYSCDFVRVTIRRRSPVF